ncbi:MAG: CAP domain-containing protein [Firmicutes bacterium]|nr:CAP domain-containing protein [Bacillota bacterium]
MTGRRVAGRPGLLRGRVLGSLAAGLAGALLLLLAPPASRTVAASWYLDAEGRLLSAPRLVATPGSPWRPANPAAEAPATGPQGASGTGSGVQPGGQASPGAGAQQATATPRPAEARLVSLINQARVQAGLRPLAVDPLLERLAEEKADEMASLGYFDHRSPTYGLPVDMERAAGIRAALMGAENIALARDVDYAMAMFMGSAPHRANLLDPRFDTVGVGVAPTARGVAVSVLFLGH